METKESQQLDETAKATLDEKRASEDTELDDLFNEEEASEDAPVTREEYNRLLKGVKTLASKQGRDKKETKTVETETVVTSNTNPVLKSLYFKANPEAESNWEEVEKEARTLGKDPFELYESSTYLRREAKAKFDEKTEDEANKAKISRPSNGVSASKNDFANVKTDADVEKLSTKQRSDYMKYQVAQGN